MSALHVLALAIIAAVFLLYLGVVRMKVVDWIGAQFRRGAAAVSDRVAGFAVVVLVITIAILIVS